MPGKKRLATSCPILLFVIWALLGLAPALADQEKSERLYVEAIRHFGQGRYEKALPLLREAAAQEPPYYLAVYYLGVTYGKLGRYAESATQLERALKLLDRSPKKNRPGSVAVRQDLAVAYYHLQRYQEALGHLEEAQKADPGNGIVLYYKGLCQHLLGDHAAAAISLRRAAELEEVVRALKMPADSPGDLARRLQQPKQGEEGWELRLSIGGQFDSNVILQPEEVPTLGVTDEDDFRLALSAGGSFDFWRTPSGRLRGGYDFFQSLHDEIKDFNLQAHLARLAASWQLSPRFRLGVEGGASYFLLGGDSYLREVHAMPFVGFRAKPWSYTLFSYRLTGANYLIAFFDPARDGLRHRIAARQYFYLFEDFERHFFLEYVYQRENPDSPLGNDYQYNRNQLEAGARIPTRWKTTLELSYLFEDNDYAFPNSRSSLGEERRDKLHGFLATVSKELAPRLEVSFGYRGRLNDSNIDDFQYSRHIAYFNLRFVLGGGL